MRVAVVDIDNTLWDFGRVLYEELRGKVPDFPPPEKTERWDFWKDYCSEDEFYGAVHAIHARQDSGEYLPYPGARLFLRRLKDLGLYIVIASHRKTSCTDVTGKWLEKHDLIYDELHLSSDKTVLFGDDTLCVVDDCPHTLIKAHNLGITATGLRFPWNHCCEDHGITLCNTLEQVLTVVKKI